MSPDPPSPRPPSAALPEQSTHTSRPVARETGGSQQVKGSIGGQTAKSSQGWGPSNTGLQNSSRKKLQSGFLCEFPDLGEWATDSCFLQILKGLREHDRGRHVTSDVLRATAAPASPTGKRGGGWPRGWPEGLGVVSWRPPAALYSLQGEELAAKPQHLGPAGTLRGRHRHLRWQVSTGRLGGSRAPRASQGDVPSGLLRAASVGPGP